MLLQMFLDSKRDCCVRPEPRQCKPADTLQSELAAANKKLERIRALCDEPMNYGMANMSYSQAMFAVLAILDGGNEK
jgi:hypothetical protein